LSLIQSLFECLGGANPNTTKGAYSQLNSKKKSESKPTHRPSQSNGNKYTGDMKDGLYDGYGILTYKNGDVYKGHWQQGKKHGQGTLTFTKDQKKYVGNWKNNLYHGDGALYFPDKSHFEGKFYAGEKHGKGKFIDPQGDEYDEEWEKGEIVRKFLKCASKHEEEDKSPDSHTKKSSNLRGDEEGEQEEYSRNHSENERKDTDKKDRTGSLDKEKEFDEKQLHSNILFKSQNDFESGEGAVNEFGVDTLNVIEHIEMLNSVAGTLLSKNVNEWTIEEVGDWLKHIGLEQYVESFKKNHINGKVLFDLSETELKDEFKMTSVGHRKNFMKAMANLKRINISEKSSEYINKKIKKFYEKNNSTKRGLLNSLGSSENRYYSHRFFTKNLYNSAQQIIEEDDEHSMKFETTSNPSPHLDAKKNQSQEHIDSLVLSEKNNRKHDYSDRSKSHNEFEFDDEIFQAKSKQTNQSSKDSKQSKQTLDSRPESPMRRAESHQDGGPRGGDFTAEAKGDVANQQQGAAKNENESSGESSSDSSSESDTSDEDGKPKKPVEEKAKEEVVPVGPIMAKLTKQEPKKPLKKNGSGVNNFKSAEYDVGTTKAKQKNYKDDRDRRHKTKGKRNVEDLTQKISEDIIRKFKESGLNENFIISYSELFFDMKIGEGGYGRVYLGKFSGIEVAIKEYGKRKLLKRSAEEFVKEVEVISNLRHPNIVLYMGACIHKGKYLMITEYLEEGSLFDHLHKKHTKISEDVMFNIIEDIALGMCYLHGRKVLHCDLKSSNILIDSNWSVKLCDFGLSRVKYKSDRKRFAKQRVGTPHWMAPEILRGEKYDESADVYSFGMVLWEMVTSEIPYLNTPIKDIINTVGYERKQIPVPTKGNAFILNMMRGCLSLDRDSRPTFKEIVGQLQQRNKGALVTNKKMF